MNLEAIIYNRVKIQSKRFVLRNFPEYSTAGIKTIPVWEYKLEHKLARVLLLRCCNYNVNLIFVSELSLKPLWVIVCFTQFGVYILDFFMRTFVFNLDII